MFGAIIQIESDDTVASSMHNDTTQKFDREDCACAVQQARFSASCAKYFSLFPENPIVSA